jgi:hypothetical protein
MVSIGLRS